MKTALLLTFSTVLLCAAFVGPVEAGRQMNGTTDKIQAGGGTVLVGLGQAAIVCSFMVSSLPGNTEVDVCSNGSQEGSGHQGPVIVSIGNGFLGGGSHFNSIVVSWWQAQPLNHNVDFFCSATISTNTWYTVVSSFQSGVTQGSGLWVNGSLCQSGTANNVLARQNGADTPDFCVAGYAGGGTTCSVVNFAGTVANFYVFGTNLPSGFAAAASLVCPGGATARRLAFPAPVRAWPLYGASGSSIEPDLSGNGFSGTLSGTTAVPAMPPCTP